MIDHYLSQYEGQQLLLFQDPSNPYESIYIRVQIDDGCMYLGDEEFAHGPGGGHSMKLFTFDRENTRKVFEVLSGGYQDPIQALKNMLDYVYRTHKFINLCQEHNIAYDSQLYL